MARTSIRYYRDLRGIKQAELAQDLGVSVPVMSEIENGVRIPTTEQVEKIAARLETPAGTLFSKHILAELAERIREAAS